MVSSWLTRAACALLCVASAAWETFSPRDASHFETERVDSPPVSRRSISERRRELQAKHLGTGTEPCHGSVMGGLTPRYRSVRSRTVTHSPDTAVHGRWDSNPRPADLESAALPLSYTREHPDLSRPLRRGRCARNGTGREAHLLIAATACFAAYSFTASLR